jgi:hypothetical protein
MSSKVNNNESEENSSKNKDRLDGDWYGTDHDRVFYAQNLGFERGEIEDAKEYAERFEDWYIVITCGPHRSYGISYTIRPDHNAIHLDYYSVRPGVGYVDDMGDDIQKGIENLREGGELDNEGGL